MIQVSQYEAKELQHLFLFTLIFSIFYLYFSFISVQTTVLVILIFGSFIGLLFIQWKKIHAVGFLNTVSEKLKIILLERSIFDILCDIWYYQAMKRFMKALLLPFIFKEHPQELIKNLEELNPKIKEVLLRKGLINILPEPIKLELIANYIQAQAQEEQKQPNEQDQEIQSIIIKKQIQIDNAMKKVLATDWDHHEDYRQFLMSKQKRVVKENHNPSLKEVIAYVMNSKKFDTRMVVNKRQMLHYIERLKITSQSLLLCSLILIILQMKFFKGSRSVYRSTGLILLCLTLMGTGGISLGLFITTRRKKHEIMKENTQALQYKIDY